MLTSQSRAGVLGATMGRALLDFWHVPDAIARGFATSSASHGIGTSAIAAAEPDTLPFCGLGYTLVGVTSSLAMNVPWLLQAVKAVTG